jgi:NDP-sugar pyrophosphorylase family protein
MINVIVLAAGHHALDDQEDAYPLCLTEFNGEALIERIARNCCSLDNARVTFAFREKDVQRHHLDNVVKLLIPGAQTITVRNHTKGAACTALLAASHIENDDELLIISANELVEVDLQDVVSAFRTRSIDAGTVVFQAVHPRYSYVRLNSQGFVLEAAEKNPISMHATAGLYWFARGRDFVRAAKSMIRKDAHIDGMFFVCPVFNEMVLDQALIGVQQIESKLYHPLKTERHVRQFEVHSDARVTV